MKYEIKSINQPIVEIVPLNKLIKFICPKNTEGIINIQIIDDSSFELLVLENSHWTINVEYPNGYINSNNTIEIQEYASLKHNIIIYEEINEVVMNQKVNISTTKKSELSQKDSPLLNIWGKK